jgi:hypothetical protein
MRRPFFRDQGVALAIGGVLFLAGSWCLHDAWERRGRPVPRLLRPLTWW